MKKRIVSLILISTFLSSSFPAFAEMTDRISVPLEGAQADTPPDNIFQIKNQAEQYILLDSNGSEESKYFIMTKDFFAPQSFDTDNSQKFVPEKVTNIGYYLNNTFLNDGDENGAEISPEVKEYIDYAHVWETEAGHPKGACPEDYTFTAGISLLSLTEYKKYIKEFGVRDELLDVWWLRTPRAISGTASTLQIVNTADALIGTTGVWDSYSPRHIRPVFYLNGNFFKNVRVETKNLGRKVKEAIRRDCSEEEMRAAGYDDEDIRRIMSSEAPVSEKAEVTIPEAVGNIYYAGNFSFDAAISSSQTQKKMYTVEYSYDGEKYKSDFIESVPGKRVTKTISVNLPEIGNFKFNVKIKDGGRIVKDANFKISVITKPKHQFMEDYSPKGFNTKDDPDDQMMCEMLGIRAHRQNREWRWVEPKKKGVYDKSMANKAVKELSDDGKYVIFGLCFNNDLYSHITSANSTKYGVFTKENVDGFANYAKKMAEWAPNVMEYEVWNEPNGSGFWLPDCTNYIDYTYLTQVTYEEMKRVNPDFNIYAGSFAMGPEKYFKGMAESGIYGFCDGVTDHPYAAYLDVKFPGNYKLLDEMNDYLPWKTQGSTEFGFSIYRAGVINFTEKQAGLDIVKHYIYGDGLRLATNMIYCFRDPGTGRMDGEESFGIIRRDLSLKESAFMAKQYLEATAGAVYMGRIETDDDAELHLYMKDGEPLLIAWSGLTEAPAVNEEDKSQGTVIASTGGVVETDSVIYPEGRITVKDHYGNVLAASEKIILKNEPVYIYGLDKSWFNKVLRDEFTKQSQKLTETVREKTGSDLLNQKLVSAEKQVLGVLDENILLTEEQVLEIINLYYEIAETLTDEYKQERIKIEELTLATLLYNIHWLMETFANYYALTVSPEEKPAVDAREEYCLQTAESDEAEAGVVGGSLKYTRAIEKYADRYIKNAEYVAGLKEENKIKAGIIKAQNLLAKETLKIAELMRDAEIVTSDRLLVQLHRQQREFFNYTKNRVDIAVYNYGKKDAKGHLELYDDEEKLVFSSDEFNLKQYENTNMTVDFMLNNYCKDPSKYVLKTIVDGAVIKEEAFTAEMKKGIDAVITPASASVDNLKTVSVMLTNLGVDTAKGSVELKAPEGWSLKETNKSYSINADSQKNISFSIDKISRTPFNNYYFDVVVKDTAGNLIMSKTLPLNFTIFTSAASEYQLSDFNGDISDWSDAYPIFINTPENPTDTESWNNSSNGTKIYSKWDKDYIYILFNVHDDAFLNKQDEGRLWDGDAVQISLDTKKTKTLNYSAGDYEYVFAKGIKGDMTVMYYPANSLITKEYVKVARKEAEKQTNYLVKLPRTDIGVDELKAGMVMGMNLAVHDADIEKRESYAELTEGTTNIKSPIHYYDWTFVNK